ncbi:glycosyltransferase family 2 protein [Patescibacteria group bacterium]|nr:glycosyltransferase family 2 protein [Patescibacteria group bacterium]
MHKLSIIIPAYNEKGTIREIIQKIKNVDLKGIEKEIIVVDDGSKDGTRDILKTISDIKYIFHEKNLGKGGAVKTGFQNATGDILIIQDADLEYDPNEYCEVIRPILEGKTEVVLGYRIMPKRDLRRHKSLYWLSWFGNHAITLLTNVLYLNNAREYEACYKAFTKKLIDSIPIKTNGFEYDNELVCKILKRGYKTVDVPIHYYPRNYSEGKKINWKDGIKILWTITKYRFIN